MLRTISGILSNRNSTWLAASLLSFLLAACGGGGAGSGPSPTLAVAAGTQFTAAGGNNVVFTAIKQFTNDPVAWRLATGSPGSLSAASGDAISYIPPAAGSVSVDMPVTVTATLGNLTKSASITLLKKTGLFLLAGKAGVNGSANGTASQAEFSGLEGIAADAIGNLYVTDKHNLTVRKITSAGVVTTLAGNPGFIGAVDGTGAAAGFNFAHAIAADRAGTMYLADTGNRTIRKITAAGVVTTIAGTAGVTGTADGIGAAASFNAPQGIAVDVNGNVYVADTDSHTIRKITTAGVVTTIAGTAGAMGNADGTGAAARFNTPEGMAVDAAGNVYVADTGNGTIRKITPAGAVTTMAGTAGLDGSVDATGAAARFTQPRGIAVDAAGNVYVADTGNQTIRKITPAGVVSTVAGVAAKPGIVVGALPGGLDTPFAITLMAPNKLAVTSSNAIFILIEQ